MSAINDALRRASSAAKSAPAGDAQNHGPASGGPPPLPPMPLPLPPLPVAQVSTPLPPRIDGSDSKYQPTFEDTAASTDATPPTRRRRSVLPYIFGALALLCAAGAAGSFLYAKQRGSFLSKYSVLNQSVEETSEEGESTEMEVEISGAAENAASVVPAPSPVATTTPTPAATPSVPAPQSVTPVPTAAPTPAPAPAPTPIRAPVAFNTQPHNPGTPVHFPPLRLQSIYYRPADPSVMINGKTLYVSDEINGVKVVDISPSSVTLVLSGRTNILTLR